MPKQERLEAMTQRWGNIDVIRAIAHNGWTDIRCVGGQLANVCGEACRLRIRPRRGRGDSEEGAKHAKNLSGR